MIVQWLQANGCKWEIFASYKNNGNFMVKKYKRNHKYNWTFQNYRVSLKVLTKHFIKTIQETILNMK